MGDWHAYIVKAVRNKLYVKYSISSSSSMIIILIIIIIIMAICYVDCDKCWLPKQACLDS